MRLTHRAVMVDFEDGRGDGARATTPPERAQPIPVSQRSLIERATKGAAGKASAVKSTTTTPVPFYSTQRSSAQADAHGSGGGRLEFSPYHHSPRATDSKAGASASQENHLALAQSIGMGSAVSFEDPADQKLVHNDSNRFFIGAEPSLVSRAIEPIAA